MDNKVDIFIYSYSKGWQTLCTLKSLLRHSKKWIDKIYLQVPKGRKPETNIHWIKKYFGEELIIFDCPEQLPEYNHAKYEALDYSNEGIRLSLYGQHCFENSDKKYVFMTHCDVLYFYDIIGYYLGYMQDNIGVGEIGMCWCCPCNKDNVCTPETREAFNPTYEEVMKIYAEYPPVRMGIIDKEQPMPLHECRLNEWASLVDREKLLSLGFPYYGVWGNTDAGCKWYRNAVLKGYKFKHLSRHFNGISLYNHGFWADGPGMHAGHLYPEKHDLAEETAKEYFINNFNHE